MSNEYIAPWKVGYSSETGRIIKEVLEDLNEGRRVTLNRLIVELGRKDTAQNIWNELVKIYTKRGFHETMGTDFNPQLEKTGIPSLEQAMSIEKEVIGDGLEKFDGD